MKVERWRGERVPNHSSSGFACFMVSVKDFHCIKDLAIKEV